MKLKLPQGAFDAYLFDCDGTIVDSMPLHYVAWKKALGEWNCGFNEELFYAWGGRPTPEIISTLNQMQGLSMPVERVAHRKEEFYFAMLPELKAGDLIVGRAMGAYTWASASEFNFFPKATVVAVNTQPGDEGSVSAI